MENWTSGYIAELGYTHGYYPELNPLRLKLVFVSAGIKPPDVINACELGFGQGVTANIHAATSAINWFGTDFNPTQANFAQVLAKESGSDARFYDESFSEFCNRDELPQFDFIALHGIWSWISDENRHQIVDFISRKLAVGGVLYVSYNTYPGLASFVPMRHLMSLHTEIEGSRGQGLLNRIDSAIDFADKLLETDPIYLKANALVKDRFEKMKQSNKNYLAHEYFNRDWHPMHFSTMAEWLEPAKLEYACSAATLDHVDIANFTKEQQAFLDGIADIRLNQSVRDFILNQQFRRDYWVKGPIRLSAIERLEELKEIRIVRIVPRESITLKLKATALEAELSEAIYNPILDALSDGMPKSIGNIFEIVSAKQIEFSQLIQALLILVSQSYIAVAQDEEVIKESRSRSAKLNSFLTKKSRSTADIQVLASPLISGGVPLNRLEIIFALAIANEMNEPQQWSNYAWSILKQQGQKLLKEGKTIESEKDNIKELQDMAADFKKFKLPVLRSLEVI